MVLVQEVLCLCQKDITGDMDCRAPTPVRVGASASLLTWAQLVQKAQQEKVFFSSWSFSAG